MKDVQNLKDERGLDINEVGISDLKIPLILNSGRDKQQIISNTKMGVSLSSVLKGTHMSRFTEIAEKIENRSLNKRLISLVLKKIKEKIHSDYARVEFSFVYFINKRAPVSKIMSKMNYECSLVGEINGKNQEVYSCDVKVPISTLCPCSKEISRNNAHNQRAVIHLEIKSKIFISAKELIKKIENSSSCELFSTLKRVDEKFVTEKMYKNPMFVEDVVRDIALWAEKDSRIEDYIVKCKSYESIHNHNAFAIIINNKNVSN